MELSAPKRIIFIIAIVIAIVSLAEFLNVISVGSIQSYPVLAAAFALLAAANLLKGL